MCCDACFNLGLSESVRLVAHLYSLRNPANIAGQARFGITSEAEQLGIAMPVLRDLARSHRRNHPLALELWASGIHDARVLVHAPRDGWAISGGNKPRTRGRVAAPVRLVPAEAHEPRVEVARRVEDLRLVGHAPLELVARRTSCEIALIPMIFVLMMQVAVMHIIQVIIMNDGGMSAIGSMDMRVFVLHGSIMSYTGLILRERIA